MSHSIQDQAKRLLQERLQKADRELDARQGDAWVEDGTFQIAQFPPAQGPAAIDAFLAHFFGQRLFTKLEHDITHVVELPDELAFQANATYTLRDGQVLTLPYSNFITYARVGEALKFKTYRVYIDASELMAKAAAASGGAA
jgi:hypothetical protein